MKKFPAWIVLSVIALVAGLLLGITNEVTKATIAEASLVAAEAARKEVISDAESFEAVTLEEGAPVDYVYIAKKGAETIGMVSQITVKGYGGEIEITVGMKNDDTITGINVGGANFSETAGLGAKTKDAEFTVQFEGKASPLTLNEDVDQVTSATISSRAVVDGVNAAAEYMMSLMG